MEHSESITKIATALLNVQKQVESVEKGSINPHFGNTYADLNTFLHAVRGPLREHGITMIQSPGMQDGWVTVETLLVHQSGEWIKGTAGSPLQKDDPQGVGSGITYLRRYSIAALLAIPQEDDDGNAASSTKSVNQSRARIPSSSMAANKNTGEITLCPQCEESEVWDNRQKKADGKFKATSPDYACKDKQGCGWAFWVDSAKAELDAELKVLVATDVISQVAANNCMSGVEDGDLSSFRIAQDWVTQKQDEAGTVGV